jgi:hypothetical protein
MLAAGLCVFQRHRNRKIDFFFHLQMQRTLTAEEAVKVQKVLAALVEPTMHQDRVASAVMSLLLFVEGDSSCGGAIVKSTSAVVNLASLLQSVRDSSSAFQQFEVNQRIVAPVFRTLSCLAVQSQSRNVFTPFATAQQIDSVIIPLLNSASGSALDALSHFLDLMVAALEGETTRTALWAAGAGLVVARRLEQFVAGGMRTGDKVEDRMALSRIVVALVGWPRIATSQDVDVFATAVFHCAGVRDAALCASLHAATAVLLANPSPSPTLLRSLSSASAHLVDAVSSAVFAEDSNSDLTAAALTFASVAVDLVPSETIHLQQITQVPQCASVVNFVRVLRRCAPEVKRNSSSTGAALNEIENAIRAIPPFLVDVHRHAMVGVIDAPRVFLAPLSTVDVDVSAAAARCLAFVVQSNPPAATRFVDLGGVSVLLDVLRDYDSTVLGGALMLLAALTVSPVATRAVVQGQLLERLLTVFKREVCMKEEPPVDLTASILLYLESVAQCPGLAVAPVDAFSGFVDDLQLLFDRLNTLHAEQGTSEQSTQKLLALAGQVSASMLRSSWPKSDAYLLSAAETFLTKATRLLQTASSSETFVALATLITASCAVGGLSIRTRAASDTALINAIVRNGIGANNAQNARASWCLLAAATSSAAEAVQHLSENPQYSTLEEAAATVCRECVAELDRRVALLPSNGDGGDDSASRGNSDTAVHVAPGALQFIAHMSPHFLKTQSGTSLSEFTQLTASLASHKASPTELRQSAVDTLQALAPRAQLDDLAHHLLAVLIACEEAEDERASMIANRAFKLMLHDPTRTMRTLFTIACEAYAVFEGRTTGEETPYRSPSRRAKAWRWFPLNEVADADDAHDLLVVLLPLLNGCLNQDQPCNDALLSLFPHEAWALFLALLENRGAELGLRVVALFAIGNLINHCPGAHAATGLISDGARIEAAFALFRGLLAAFIPASCTPLSIAPLDPAAVGATHAILAELAGRGLPNSSTLNDAVETLYYIAERCVIFARSLAMPHYQWAAPGGHAPQRPAYLLRGAIRDVAAYSSARSFVLLLLQDASEVRTNLNDPTLRDELVAALREIGRIDSSTGVQQQVLLHLSQLGNGM